MINYLARIGSAWSQLMNTILLNGDPNESVSGRAYREDYQTAVWIINSIFFWQSNHCRGAHNKDVEWAKNFK